ncbi:MAG: universal stress protein [Actinomycetota bacterium]
MKTILIATDGSVGAQAAVEEGLDLASETGADVLFVAIRQPPYPILGDPYWQQSLSNELARLRPALKDAVERANSRGIHADYDLLEGDPAERILDLAGSRDVDLIVIGSRGLGSVASAILGSVSKRVLHDADRPVLVVNQPAAVPVTT